jgi:hypothetical protein
MMDTLHVNWTIGNDKYYSLNLEKPSKAVLAEVLQEMKDNGDILGFNWVPDDAKKEICKYLVYSDLNADLISGYFGIDCNYPHVPSLLGSTSLIDDATKALIDAANRCSQQVKHWDRPEEVSKYVEVIESLTDELVKTNF